MKPIRNSAKAIIISNFQILLTKNEDTFGVFYLLPGGGQEPEENIHEALKRECMEEISSEVLIKDIVFVRDYIGRNHEYAEWDGEMHQIEYMFECELISKNEPASGHIPDNAQIGVEWVDLRKFSEIRIYPSILKRVIHEDGSLEKIVYLGDVN